MNEIFLKKYLKLNLALSTKRQRSVWSDKWFLFTPYFLVKLKKKIQTDPHGAMISPRDRSKRNSATGSPIL